MARLTRASEVAARYQKQLLQGTVAARDADLEALETTCLARLDPLGGQYLVPCVYCLEEEIDCSTAKKACTHCVRRMVKCIRIDI